MSNVIFKKLSDIGCGLLSGFAFKSSYYSDHGVPLIKIGNIQNNIAEIDLNGDFISFDLVNEKAKSYILCDGDVLIAMTGQGSVGRVGKLRLRNGQIAVLNQRVGKFICDEIGVNKGYLYYLLSSNKYQDFLFNSGAGSGQPNLSPELILQTEIPWVEYSEQKAIASVLSSLDDKIYLLHRQNATLEKMAETLFRQWFIEEAKDDWEVGKISDSVLHFKDSIHPQKNQTTLYFHYSIPAFDNGKNPVKELGQEIQSSKYKVPQYCILFSKLNPHKDKRVWLLQQEVEKNAICSTEFQVVLPKKKEYLYFLYGWLSIKENYNEIASGVGGTSGSHQRIDSNTIFDFHCPVIAENIIEKFNIEIEPFYKKQFINQTQIRTLTALRDTLLPKLMSGEVKINF